MANISETWRPVHQSAFSICPSLSAVSIVTYPKHFQVRGEWYEFCFVCMLYRFVFCICGGVGISRDASSCLQVARKRGLARVKVRFVYCVVSARGRLPPPCCLVCLHDSYSVIRWSVITLRLHWLQTAAGVVGAAASPRLLYVRVAWRLPEAWGRMVYFNFGLNFYFPSFLTDSYVSHGPNFMYFRVLLVFVYSYRFFFLLFGLRAAVISKPR